MSEEAITKTLTFLVRKGKIYTAVHFVTLQGELGVFLLNDIDLKLGQPVINMLYQKHLARIVPVIEVFKHYNVVPELVPLNVTEDTIESISGKLSGIASSDRIDAASLQQWLLRFGVSSQRQPLCCAVTSLTR